ncbi:YciI family protein [Phenylobacterium sp.]|uniref:YciI family protein n=1 Tax=Phenylobacterium sp. TaxID=1871053 RepID=UPI002EDAC5BA
MKYICLVYAEPGALSDLSPDEQATLDRDSLAYDERLQQKGHFIAASALQGVKTARTVRVRRGKSLVTDGPFAETKEVLCGFIFIEAPDAEEALRIAEGIPMARYGSIEVRPELDFG